MSIQDVIKYWMSEGQLFQVFPRLLGSPVNRVLLASEAVNRLVTGPWEDAKEEIRCGRLWADFDRFIEGRLISMSLESPYSKPRTTYMARLHPPADDVIEIRSRARHKWINTVNQSMKDGIVTAYVMTTSSGRAPSSAAALISGRSAPTASGTGPGRGRSPPISIRRSPIASFARCSVGRKSPAGFQGHSWVTKRRCSAPRWQGAEA
jgi:hypothetical protein